MKRSRRIRKSLMGAALLFSLGLYAANSSAAPPPPIKAAPAIKPVLIQKTGSNLPPASPAPNPVLNQAPVLKAPLTKCPELKWVTADVLPAAQQERDYSYRLIGSGGSGELSFLMEEKTLPPAGLKLMANGTILGKPSKPGEYGLTIVLQDKCAAGIQQVRKKFFFKVNPEARLLVTGPESSDNKTPLPLSPTNKAPIQTGPTVRMLTPPNPDSPTSKQPDSSKRPLALTRPDPNLKTGDLKTSSLSGVTGPAGTVAAPPDPDSAEVPHVQSQIVVTVQMERGGQILKLLQDKYKLKLLESFTVKALKQIVATFGTDRDLTALIREIRRESGVILAQKNQIYGTYAEPKSDLQNLCGLMDFSKLHKYRRGKRIKVALIDTGVDLAHEDLKTRIVYSRNFIKGSSYRAEAHGTAVAGIIAASINGFGIEGIAPEVDILALRACEQVSEKETLGRGYTVSIIQALDIAIEKKARIVNMSFGSTAPDPIITSLIIEGARQGILFVAPVGNRPGQEYPAFPASCPGVIAVGGLDQSGSPFPDNHLASFAKVIAPAENIFTTLPGNKYNFMTGTSFSSAIVTGILALGIENNPGLSIDNLPEKNNDFCAWVEALLHIRAICRP